MSLLAAESPIDVWWHRDVNADPVAATGPLRSSAVLATVLSRYVTGPITLERDTFGKPRLAREIDGTLEFSLSHSGDWTAVAVTRGAAVGIDLERPRTFASLELFIDRCCIGAEAEELRRRPEAERGSAMLRLWTVKEAYVKALGTGIRGKMREVVTRAAPREEGWLVSGAASWTSGAQGEWHAQGIWAPDGYVATVCCTARGRPVRSLFCSDADPRASTS